MPTNPAIDLIATDGSRLSVALLGRTEHETNFSVSVETPWLRASAPASTYVNGSPAALFRDLADNWRGWTGEKRWEDIEGRVRFAAMTDSKGHVSLNVGLKGQNYPDRADVSLRFEAGALDAMSRRVNSLFSSDET
jgi:hypothetical protein